MSTKPFAYTRIVKLEQGDQTMLNVPQSRSFLIVDVADGFGLDADVLVCLSTGAEIVDNFASLRSGDNFMLPTGFNTIWMRNPHDDTPLYVKLTCSPDYMSTAHISGRISIQNADNPNNPNVKAPIYTNNAKMNQYGIPAIQVLHVPTVEYVKARTLDIFTNTQVGVTLYPPKFNKIYCTRLYDYVAPQHPVGDGGKRVIGRIEGEDVNMSVHEFFRAYSDGFWLNGRDKNTLLLQGQQHQFGQGPYGAEWSLKFNFYYPQGNLGMEY